MAKPDKNGEKKRMKGKEYAKELRQLQSELSKLQGGSNSTRACESWWYSRGAMLQAKVERFERSPSG